MGLAGLTATGVCSMVGAGINVIPFMIQRNVPGIGPFVLEAFAFAALPAVLAAIAYAVLASAMPRAGGSYVYVSRGLGPYLGFVASFSQWFALSIAIGVVSYVFVPFVRDIAIALGWSAAAASLDTGWVRLTLSLAVLWAAAGVNLLGVAIYERLMVALMFLTFILAGVVIVAGFSFDHADFAAAVLARDGRVIPAVEASPLDWARGRPGSWTFLSASAVLFASFIGFDSIAQAGGEAKNPGRNLPLAIALAVGSVGVLYMLFTAAVYHAVPWQYVADEAQRRDLTAPGLLGYLLPPFWTVIIISAAAVALAKDLPAMLLAVSRLMFAWAGDGIFPRAIATVHPVFRTPHVAIVAERSDGHHRHPWQPSGGRFLPGRGHPGVVDAGELPDDGRVGADAAAAESGARAIDSCPAERPGTNDGGRARRRRAGRVSRRAHVEGSDRAGRGSWSFDRRRYGPS